MSWTLTLADFWAHGLPPAACVPEARLVASVDVGTGLFELAQHGFFGGEIVRLRASGTGSALPTGTSRLTYYTVETPPGPDFFALAGVTMTDAGAGVITVLENPLPWILAILAAVSSLIVASHTATLGPWAVPPGWAPMVGGQLAAYRVGKRLRTSSPLYKLDDLRKDAEAAQVFLDKLTAGKPYNDGVGPVDATPLVAEEGPIAVELEGRQFQDGPDGDRA